MDQTQSNKRTPARRARHQDGDVVHNSDGTVTLWVEYPEAMIRAMKRVSKQMGISLNEWLRRAVLQKLNQSGNSPITEKEEPNEN